MYDLLLKNGHVIDPLNQIDGRKDVAIEGGTVAAVEDAIDSGRATRTVDVEGRCVTPGLVDIHTHVFHTRAPEGSPEGLSVVADAHSFRSGVTTMVDTGTAGARHFEHFKTSVIDRQKTRIFAFINISDQGMLGAWEQDPRTFDAELAASTVKAFPDTCVGVKTAHYWTHQPYDDLHTTWAAVDRAVEAAELCGKPLMVDFWPRPPERSYQQLILEKMRPGDIHTHVYAQQFPIVGDDGKPNDFLFEARERGVIFDVGHGAASFWFRNAAPAMAGGFGPDSISTDLHTGNVHGVVLDMLTTMNKILNLGMPLQEVIYRSTVTPAKEIGHPELGHLSVGACADVAVLNLRTGTFGYMDCGRAKIRGDKKLECALTVRAGQIVFDGDALSAPDWQNAPEAYWRLPKLG
jgi:dihydroorotase